MQRKHSLANGQNGTSDEVKGDDVVISGKLTQIGSGKWKYVSAKGGKTRFSVLEIGDHKVHDVTVPDALKDHMLVGQELSLLILRTDLLHKTLCGIKSGGTSYRHGATLQLAAAIFLGALLSWLIIPFILAVYFLRNYMKIESF